MNRSIAVVTAALAASLFALPATALAQSEMPSGEHYKGGLGFHDIEAPVGVRWWMAGQKVGIDLGFGFSSTSSLVYADEKLSGFAISAGIPIVMKSWSKVHVIFRPGILYESDQVEVTSPPTPFDTDDIKAMSITGEIEAEVFLMDNFSVSASHGIGYTSVDVPGLSENLTSFGTLGNNFTNIGFHVYFLGGSQ